MRAYRYCIQLYRSFIQYIIVRNKKQSNIQNGIKTPTGSITIGLFGHEPAKQRIKPVNYLKNKPTNEFVQLLHNGARR